MNLSDNIFVEFLVKDDWMKYLLPFLFIIFNSYSLVDYTSSSINQFQPEGNTNIQKVVRKPKPKTRRITSGRKWLSLTPYYESLNVKTAQEGQINFTGLQLALDTGYGITLKNKYYQASSSAEEISETSSSQAGNFEFLVGFNWLSIGQRDSGANFDVVAGGRLKNNGSDFASSRNDKIIGLETSKSIDRFVLGLGALYTLTGDPSESSEMAIGNITTFTSALGWFATPDIRFSLEGKVYKISAESNESLDNRLSEEIRFSSVSPKLYLSLSPNIQMIMGATFQTRQLSRQDKTRYLDAKLFALNGAYGNTLFSSLSFSL